MTKRPCRYADHRATDRPTLQTRRLLQCRDINLELSSPAFPLDRIWRHSFHPQIMLTKIKYWEQEGTLNEPWHPVPAISEGKSRAEMIWSLFNEPIRRPVGLALVPSVGLAYLNVPGNNRFSAAILRGLPTIPAVATAVWWPTGSTEPSDDEVKSVWFSIIDGSAPIYDAQAAILFGPNMPAP
jgi:hypothetical protein